MAVATSTAQGARTLSDFSGTIVLVGAGKMGGAMLESWLSLGLAARTVLHSIQNVEKSHKRLLIWLCARRPVRV